MERGLPSSHSSLRSQEWPKPLGRGGTLTAGLTGLLLLQAVSWASGERVEEECSPDDAPFCLVTLSWPLANWCELQEVLKKCF